MRCRSLVPKRPSHGTAPAGAGDDAEHQRDREQHQRDDAGAAAEGPEARRSWPRRFRRAERIGSWASRPPGPVTDADHAVPLVDQAGGVAAVGEPGAPPRARDHGRGRRGVGLRAGGAATVALRHTGAAGAAVAGSTMWWSRTPPRRHVRRTVEDVATAQPAARVTWPAGSSAVSWTRTCQPRLGCRAGGGDVAAELDQHAGAEPSAAARRASGRRPGPWRSPPGRARRPAGQLEACRRTAAPAPARHGVHQADRRAVRWRAARCCGRSRAPAACAPTVGSTSPPLASAASSAVPTRSASSGESRCVPAVSAGQLGVGAEARAGQLDLVQARPDDLDDRAERSRVGDDHRGGGAPQLEAVRRAGTWSCQDPLVVACGVVFAGLLTGLLTGGTRLGPARRRRVVVLLRARLRARRRARVRWAEPVPLAVPWLGGAALLVWVVRPSPTAAPRALTTLSPARPAWRRRLRLMWVMSSPCAASCADPVQALGRSCRLPDQNLTVPPGGRPPRRPSGAGNSVGRRPVLGENHPRCGHHLPARAADQPAARRHRGGHPRPPGRRRRRRDRLGQDHPAARRSASSWAAARAGAAA